MTQNPSFTAIEFDLGDDHVATISLNRPEVLNAFDGHMASDMAEAWTRVRDDDDIHAVLLRANGERAFSAGLDLRSEMDWLFPPNVWNQEDPGVSVAPKSKHKVWKPVVVAIHGICAGGAQYFINEADIIICSDDAEFFDPHANGGIVSACEPIGMLCRGVPLGDVLRWALMGTEERITATTALRLGLVSEVVPRDLLFERAHAIAASIAARNPRAVQGTVRAIWESLDLPRSVAVQNGLSYTQIGNVPNPDGPPRRNEKPAYR